SRLEKSRLHTCGTRHGRRVSPPDFGEEWNSGLRIGFRARNPTLYGWRLDLCLVRGRFRIVWARHSTSAGRSEEARLARLISLLAKSDVRRRAHSDLRLGGSISKPSRCAVWSCDLTLLLFLRRILRRAYLEQTVRYRL